MKELGTLMIDDAEACVTDALFDFNDSFCFISLVAQQSDMKHILSSFSKFFNEGIFPKKNSLKTIQKDESGERTNYGILIPREDSIYTISEKPISFGYSFCAICISDFSRLVDVAIFKKDCADPMFQAFLSWIEKIPLPIPNDKDLLKAIYRTLVFSQKMVAKKSISGLFEGLFFSKDVFDNNLFMIRNIVEEFYSQEVANVG